MPAGKKSSIILGIDPGIADTGYGVIAKDGGNLQCLDYGSIRTPKNTALGERLMMLEKELDGLIDKYCPEIVGVEQLFFCNNATTAFMVGQARGVVLLTAAKHDLEIREFTPLQVKQAVCGYGKAQKQQIQQIVKLILGLKEIPKPDDAADALAVAICSCNDNMRSTYAGGC